MYWTTFLFLSTTFVPNAEHKKERKLFLCTLICNLNIFPLISPNYIFSIKELTLKLKIIGQCDVKHNTTFPIKNTTSVLKVFTYMITNIAMNPIRLTAILVMMSVAYFKTAVIPYIYTRHYIHRNDIMIQTTNVLLK